MILASFGFVKGSKPPEIETADSGENESSTDL